VIVCELELASGLTISTKNLHSRKHPLDELQLKHGPVPHPEPKPPAGAILGGATTEFQTRSGPRLSAGVSLNSNLTSEYAGCFQQKGILWIVMWHDVFPEFDSVSEKADGPDSLSAFDRSQFQPGDASMIRLSAACSFVATLAVIANAQQ